MGRNGGACVIREFFTIWAWIVLVVAYYAGSLALILGTVDLLTMAGCPPAICVIFLLVSVCLVTTFIAGGLLGDSVKVAAVSSVVVTAVISLLGAVAYMLVTVGQMLWIYISTTAIYCIIGLMALVVTFLIALYRCR